MKQIKRTYGLYSSKKHLDHDLKTLTKCFKQCRVFGDVELSVETSRHPIRGKEYELQYTGPDELWSFLLGFSWGRGFPVPPSLKKKKKRV